MKRILLITLMIMEASILSSCGASAEKTVKQPEVQVPNDMPNMTIAFLDGSQIQAKKLEGNTVMIVFFPDCDHCQREAVEIQKNLASFKNHTLYFLSTAPKEEVEKFSTDYKLNNLKNVRFGIITVQDVFSNFGSIPTPSLYIYSSQHKLVQKFNGETPLDQILKYIK